MLRRTTHCSSWTRSGPHHVSHTRCSGRHTHATHRASSRAQSRTHKRLWQLQAESQRGCREKFAKSLCYSVAAAGSAGSNRDSSGPNVQVCTGVQLWRTCLQDRRQFLANPVFAVGAGQATFFAETCSGRSARSYARVCGACSTSCKLEYGLLFAAPPRASKHLLQLVPRCHGECHTLTVVC